jgi:hypothetical protein
MHRFPPMEFQPQRARGARPARRHRLVRRSPRRARRRSRTSPTWACTGLWCMSQAREPGKLLPTPKGKAATRPAGKKVDKNALSATGSAPKKPPPKPQPSPPPAPARKLPSHVPAPPPTGANALGREGKQRGEAKRKGERSGSDSPPYKSPRGSDVEDESDMSEDEPDTGDLFGGHWDSDYG